MKKGVVFFLGVLLGVALTIGTLTLVEKYEKEDNGMTFFEQPGECLSTSRFEVLQALGTYALAYEQKYNDFLGYMPTDLLVLVANDNGEMYYDEQVIKVPKGQCMRQIGIYRYQTKNEDWKTVPIVKLMDK